MQKKTALFLMSVLFLTMGLMSFQNNSEKEAEPGKKKYCIWLRQHGKNWYECSPEAYTPSNAVDLVKKKYPKAKVTRSSDSNCDCG